MIPVQGNILPAILAVAAILVIFPLYYLVIPCRGAVPDSSMIIPDPAPGATLKFIIRKMTGFILIAIIPALIFFVILGIKPSSAGIKAGSWNSVWYPLLGAIPVSAVITFFSAGNPKLKGMFPELRTRDWYSRHLFVSVSCWLVYIFGYEFTFRGILWFLCANAFGFWWALPVNILLYSLAHIPQGRMMVLSAIPFGIVLCLLSAMAGSFLPAFLLHAVTAVTMELSSFYHNPEFRFVNKKI